MDLVVDSRDPAASARPLPLAGAAVAWLLIAAGCGAFTAQLAAGAVDDPYGGWLALTIGGGVGWWSRGALRRRLVAGAAAAGSLAAAALIAGSSPAGAPGQTVACLVAAALGTVFGLGLGGAVSLFPAGSLPRGGAQVARALWMAGGAVAAAAAAMAWHVAAAAGCAASAGFVVAAGAAVALALVATMPVEPGPDRAPGEPRAGLVRLLALVALALAIAGLADGAPSRGPWLAAAVLLLGVAAPTGALLPLLAGLAVVGAALVPVRAGSPRPPRCVEVADEGRAAVAYDRAKQELLLQWDDIVVDVAGPERVHAELAAVLVGTQAAAGDRILLLGAEPSRLAEALRTVACVEVDVATLRPVPRELAARLLLDGPVPPVPGPPPVGSFVHAPPWRAVLEALPAAARQAIVVGEPLHELAGDLLLLEVQQLLRRVVGTGCVVQPFLLDGVPPDRLRRLLAAAAVAHPWNGVFAVGDCAVLLSAGRAPDLAGRGEIASWPAAARWLAHAAHVGECADLERALLGTVAAAPAPRDDDGLAVGRPAALRVLHELLQPPPAPPAAGPDALLWRWVGETAAVRRAVETVRGIAAPGGIGAEERERAQREAARLLHRGAPAAELQAALGLGAADGVSLLAPEAAALRAAAIDPTLFDALPPVLAGLPQPRRRTGELEDVAALPAGRRLAELSVGDGAFAVALRARFPARCARALVDRLADGPLPPAAAQALRELADPFVLAEAGRVLAAQGRSAELLGLWRGDLPMPAALAPLARTAPTTLAPALVRRTDARSLDALALLMTADDLAVRQTAAAVLADLPGGPVAYDPAGSREDWNAAAARLRALHNRGP